MRTRRTTHHAARNVTQQTVRNALRLMGAGGLAAAMTVGSVPGQGSAVPASPGCTDVEVVFARGTFEAPGIGRVGEGFVDALQAQLGPRTVNIYAVNYPASIDFGRAADGVVDASDRIRDVANRCPSTQIVLGGYSQGAAVSGYVTGDTVPAGYVLPAGLAGPMPSTVAEHVTAVALFGKPSAAIMGLAYRDAPPLTIGAPYASKTLDLCAPADPVCQTGSLDRAAHSAYVTNGMTSQAADFAAQRVLAHDS